MTARSAHCCPPSPTWVASAYRGFERLVEEAPCGLNILGELVLWVVWAVAAVLCVATLGLFLFYLVPAVTAYERLVREEATREIDVLNDKLEKTCGVVQDLQATVERLTAVLITNADQPAESPEITGLPPVRSALEENRRISARSRSKSVSFSTVALQEKNEVPS